jgi:hypothetical protein
MCSIFQLSIFLNFQVILLFNLVLIFIQNNDKICSIQYFVCENIELIVVLFIVTLKYFWFKISVV